MNSGKNSDLGSMGRFTKILINLAVTLAVGFLLFYVTLPAINLHSADFYTFAGTLCAVYIVCAIITSGFRNPGGISAYFGFVKSQCKIPAAVIILLVAVFAVGSLSSAVFFRAGAYSRLITLKQGNFTQDVKEASFDKIPMLDKDSAEKLGDRKL
ncbi:MAG: CvpA family protein, partial [Bacillota bacterium]|nr:CvpA family protein [Bacillota bacterium]